MADQNAQFRFLRRCRPDANPVRETRAGRGTSMNQSSSTRRALANRETEFPRPPTSSGHNLEPAWGVGGKDGGWGVREMKEAVPQNPDSPCLPPLVGVRTDTPRHANGGTAIHLLHFVLSNNWVRTDRCFDDEHFKIERDNGVCSPFAFACFLRYQ